MALRFRNWAGWVHALTRRADSKSLKRRRNGDGEILAAIVETLEPRLMLSATGGDDGHDHTHCDEDEEGHGPGCNCGACGGTGAHVEHDDDHSHDEHCHHEYDIYGNEVHSLAKPDEALDPGTTGNFDGEGTLSDLNDTFKLHSNPNSNFKIYLDFDGHTTSGTSWNSSYNGGNDIVTSAYSFQGDSSFTDAEKTRIQYIWQRVAEDFLPFDVDVTTEDPGVEGLRRSGGGDTAYGIRVVIGGNGSWYGSAGGVAYVGSFDWSSDTPTYVFEDNLGNGNEKFTAEAISHEVGHTLGLSHDGQGGSGYYQGHGSGATGWAPIMGSGYYKDLTQWSKGEYNNANQTQDDLSIITTTNGFGYRTDDYGNTNGTAGNLVINGTSATGSGIIERNTDVDVHEFTTGDGTISFDINAVYRGPNLDILAELYNSSGTLITSSNPDSLLSASFSQNVSAGTYYLHISGVGKGNPLSTGYTDYGSLGGYVISGTVVSASPNSDFSIAATSADKSEGDSGTTAFTFTITRTGNTSIAATVDYAVSGNGGNPAVSGDFSGGFPSGTVSFSAGETSKVITVLVNGDTTVESDEGFKVVLSNPSDSNTISTSTAVGTIQNDDVAPSTFSIAATSADKNEGNSGTTAYTFTVTRGGNTSTAVTVDYTVSGNGGNPASSGDFNGGFGSATVSFSAGQTTKTITVLVNGDTTVENDEGFKVVLSNPSGNNTISTSTATGTIRNDDVAPATFSIAATSANKNEGNSGTTAFTFTVTRGGNTSTAVTVDYNVSGNGGNAATAGDFNGGFGSGTVSFSAGQTSKTITVLVNGDTTVENDEGFKVVLSNASGNSTITTSTANGTIQNDDIAPATFSIAATSANKNEGNSGTTAFTFTVTRGGNTSTAVTVDYTVSGNGGNAASAGDFNGGFGSGTVSFSAGQTSKTITVLVNGDTTVENDEGFKVVLSNASGNSTITTSTANGTIQNDDVAPATFSIAATSADKNEGNSGTTAYTFTVTRGGNTTTAVTVDYNVSGNGGNAATAGDFNGGFGSGTVSFSAGQTSKTITVLVIGDTTVENDEGFKVVLSNPSGNNTISTSTATGTIRNDDVAPATFSIAATSANKNEGNSGTTAFTFTVTRGGNTSTAVTVDYNVSGNGGNAASAGDFNGGFGSGTVSFSAGQTSKTITVLVNGDTTVENDEGFKVVLSNASGNNTITTSTATGTIQNDDIAPATFSIAATSANKSEGNSGTTAFTFTVTRSGNTSTAVTVDYNVSGNGGNAANAADFNGGFGSGTVSFSAGQTSKTITVLVNGDTTVENNEGFKVVLSNASGNSTISTSTANGTIQNDDSAPSTFSIAATSADKNEGNSGTTAYTFTVTRGGNTSTAVTVDYTVSGNGGSPASAGDFNGGFGSGTVSFSAGQTSKTITVLVNGDTTVESDEGFKVVLSNPSGNNTINTSTATGTIRNDDVAPATFSIAATSANKNEGNSGTTAFTFTVTRGGNTSTAVTVDYTVSGNGGNAASAGDFNGGFGSGTVSFSAGQTTKTITVLVNGDTTIENDEGFKVVLSNASGNNTISTSTATGTIQNDDSAPANFSIAATSANKSEGNSGTKAFTFTVTRSGNVSIQATVDYTVSGNGATPASSNDFNGGFGSGTLTFLAGQTSKTVTVLVNGDTTVENNEGFKVVLSNASNGSNITTSTATGTIQNDDVAPSNFSITATSADKNEGNSGTTAFTFTVTRGGNTGTAVTVDYTVSGNGANAASSGDFSGGFGSGTVSFAAGQTSKTVTVLVKGENLIESDEGFKVVLSNPSGNNTISTSTATGTIRNDDTAPNIAGVYLTGSLSTSVEQSGQNLTFYDPFGNSSSGKFLSTNQVEATNWGGLTATIDGNGNLTWQDGSVWVAIDYPEIGGSFLANNLVTKVGQDGGNLTFTDPFGNSSAGRFLSATKVEATNWGGLTATIDADGNLKWVDGSVWLKANFPDLGGLFYANGQTTSVEQDGADLTFKDPSGNSSSGQFLGLAQVRASNWNLTATLDESGNIYWSDGSVWQKAHSALLNGEFQSGGQPTSIERDGHSLIFSDVFGNQSSGRLLGPNKVEATNWGLTGTFDAVGNLNWSEGSVWVNVKSNYPDISGNYTVGSGSPRIEQSGKNLTFFNENGGSSAGVFISLTQVQATGWGNLVGTLQNGNIHWANGTVWNKVANGPLPGQLPAAIPFASDSLFSNLDLLDTVIGLAS